MVINNSGREEKKFPDYRPVLIQVSQPGNLFPSIKPQWLLCEAFPGWVYFSLDMYVLLFTLPLLHLDVYEILFASMPAYKYIANTCIVPTLCHTHLHILHDLY